VLFGQGPVVAEPERRLHACGSTRQFSADLARRHKLVFQILHDHGLRVAKSFALLFTLPTDLKDPYLNTFKAAKWSFVAAPDARAFCDRPQWHPSDSPKPTPTTRCAPNPRKPLRSLMASLDGISRNHGADLSERSV
jgi:hypothetical protein